MQVVTTGVVFRPQSPPERLREAVGAAEATSVVFRGSAEAPDAGPLIRALAASAGPAAHSEPSPSG